MLAQPAAATITIGFGYKGTASFTPPRGSPTRYDETGLGWLEVDEAATSATLAQGLSGFSFTTELAQTVSPAGGAAFTVPGTVTYGLADLRNLQATYSNGQLATLTFETVSKAASYGSASRVSFAAYTQPNGYILGRSAPDGGPGIFGLVTAVPEPGTWVMLVAGFGTLGCALRRRRAQPLPVAR